MVWQSTPKSGSWEPDSYEHLLKGIVGRTSSADGLWQVAYERQDSLQNIADFDLNIEMLMKQTILTKITKKKKNEKKKRKRNYERQENLQNMAVVIFNVEIRIHNASGGSKLCAVCSHGSRPSQKRNAHGPG